jgi:hypothetical protein
MVYKHYIGRIFGTVAELIICRSCRVIVHTFELRKWFPPQDPLAVTIARLCILREDLFLEMQGILADQMSVLDGNSAEWRRMYFFRASIRTLMELRSAVESLNRNRDFQNLLARQPKQLQDDFRKQTDKFNSAHELVKGLRNAIGGHILESSVIEALNRMSDGRKGTLRVGAKTKDVHYTFSGELVIAILLVGVPEQQQRTKMNEMFERTSELLPLPLIDSLLEMYLSDRGLSS